MRGRPGPRLPGGRGRPGPGLRPSLGSCDLRSDLRTALRSPRSDLTSFHWRQGPSAPEQEVGLLAPHPPGGLRRRPPLLPKTGCVQRSGPASPPPPLPNTDLGQRHGGWLLARGQAHARCPRQHWGAESARSHVTGTNMRINRSLTSHTRQQCLGSKVGLRGERAWALPARRGWVPSWRHESLETGVRTGVPAGANAGPGRLCPDGHSFPVKCGSAP